jgi:hypothetical protein
MSVRQPTPSPTVQDLADKCCRDISTKVLKVPEDTLGQVRSTLRAGHPLKVYLLGTLAVVEEKDLAGAVPVAWRFLILRGERTIASAEISLEDNERGPRWIRTSYDPRPRLQLATIQRMLSHPSIRNGNFELRFLRIPGLDLNTLLWFHAANGTRDRLVQLGKGHLLRAAWPYYPEQLFSGLRPHAERRRTEPPPAKNSRKEPGADSLVQIEDRTEGGAASGRGEA